MAAVETEAATFVIEVAYAKPDVQVLQPLEVNAPITIQQAIEQSGLLARFPEIDLSKNKVGIFSKLKKLNEPLRAGDRVEIYRELIADPKAVRKQKAAEGKVMRKGGTTASTDDSQNI